MARVYMYVRSRIDAKGHMLYLVGLIDSVRYDLSCSYMFLPYPARILLMRSCRRLIILPEGDRIILRGFFP